MGSYNQKLDRILAEPRQDQVRFLLECSQQGSEGIQHWNHYREQYPDQPIWLEGWDFSEAFLENANLKNTHILGSFFHNARIENAVILNTDLYRFLLECSVQKNILTWNLWRCKHLDQEIWLHEAMLENSFLEDADLKETQLDKANLSYADFQRADFGDVSLVQADLTGTKLQGATLTNVNLTKGQLRDSKLGKTCFKDTVLNSANFRFAQCDQHTIFKNCTIDLNTDTTGIDLDQINIDYPLKAKLKVIRQYRQRLYQHPILASLEKSVKYLYG